jgi:hypothetical protein
MSYGGVRFGLNQLAVAQQKQAVAVTINDPLQFKYSRWLTTSHHYELLKSNKVAKAAIASLLCKAAEDRVQSLGSKNHLRADQIRLMRGSIQGQIRVACNPKFQNRLLAGKEELYPPPADMQS